MGWGGLGLRRGAGRPSSGHRAEMAVGTAPLGREEAEIKGSSKPALTIATPAGWGLLSKTSPPPPEALHRCLPAGLPEKALHLPEE